MPQVGPHFLDPYMALAALLRLVTLQLDAKDIVVIVTVAGGADVAVVRAFNAALHSNTGHSE